MMASRPRRRLGAIGAALRPPASPRAASAAEERYSAESLRSFCSSLLQAAGMEEHQAAVVAATCVEGDLLNHNTHGVRLLGTALSDLRGGKQNGTGEPTVVADTGSTLILDGGEPLMNGLYLTAKAVETAMQRSEEHGVATVVVRRSGHTGCLQAFLVRPSPHPTPPHL